MTMTAFGTFSKPLGLSLLVVGLAFTSACSKQPRTKADIVYGIPDGVDLDKRAFALREVKVLQNAGRRVWCVPFARNASGIQIRGDAHTWWASAKGVYDRGSKPRVGSVMSFKSTSGMSLGHVAMVSKVVSEREVLIDHANWSRNKVSLGMSVIDVSDKGDWSRVRVMSNPGSYGKVYPVNGFIHADRIDA
ncbi:CHAP domain-containing protein [Pacificoceanicola onchidii]|uniref:CHAP domain-containing protein n=1 Tax=Pacificoceanicola onchidii TaxID=2562685 RepID=UPI001F0EF430|nr:CHAP domain-containing protein [Pacificoceanicola onchidii]